MDADYFKQPETKHDQSQQTDPPNLAIPAVPIIRLSTELESPAQFSKATKTKIWIGTALFIVIISLLLLLNTIGQKAQVPLVPATKQTTSEQKTSTSSNQDSTDKQIGAEGKYCTNPINAAVSC